MTDFNLASNGETADTLLMLVQDIETIMTSDDWGLAIGGNASLRLDNYLFKYGVDTSRLASMIEERIGRLATNPKGYDVNVSCTLTSAEQSNDLLLVSVSITTDQGGQKQLDYIVSAMNQAFNLAD